MPTLESIAYEISDCILCDAAGLNVIHVPPMERGTGTELLVIGTDPGRREVATAKAFVGPAGRRLMEWLTAAGFGDTREQILERCYLTSLCKCHLPSQASLKKAASNCFPFLETQIQLVAPKICVTLGPLPFNTLFGLNANLSSVVGNVFYPYKLSITPVLPDDCVVVPFPHPSPRSRWLNDETNHKLLSMAIDSLSEVAS